MQHITYYTQTFLGQWIQCYDFHYELGETLRFSDLMRASIFRSDFYVLYIVFITYIYRFLRSIHVCFVNFFLHYTRIVICHSCDARHSPCARVAFVENPCFPRPCCINNSFISLSLCVQI